MDEEKIELTEETNTEPDQTGTANAESVIPDDVKNDPNYKELFEKLAANYDSMTKKLAEMQEKLEEQFRYTSTAADPENEVERYLESEDSLTGRWLKSHRPSEQKG